MHVRLWRELPPFASFADRSTSVSDKEYFPNERSAAARSHDAGRPGHAQPAPLPDLLPPAGDSLGADRLSLAHKMIRNARLFGDAALEKRITDDLDERGFTPDTRSEAVRVFDK